MAHSLPFFLYFRLFNTVESKQMFNKFCQWLVSNLRPLVFEATALPTEPQPLPNQQPYHVEHTSSRPFMFILSRLSLSRVAPVIASTSTSLLVWNTCSLIDLRINWNTVLLTFDKHLLMKLVMNLVFTLSPNGQFIYPLWCLVTCFRHTLLLKIVKKNICRSSLEKWF